MSESRKSIRARLAYTSSRIVNLILLDEAHHEVQVVRGHQHVRRDCLVIIVVWHLSGSAFDFVSDFGSLFAAQTAGDIVDEKSSRGPFTQHR